MLRIKPCIGANSVGEPIKYDGAAAAAADDDDDDDDERANANEISPRLV